MLLNDPINRRVTEALRAWRMAYEGGLSMDQSLVSAGRVCKGGARRAFERAADDIRGNAEFDSAMMRLRRFLTYADRAMLAAGWAGGELPLGLKLVAERRELLHEARKNIRSGLFMPMGIFLIALVVVPFPDWFLGKITSEQYAERVLIPYCAVVGFGLICVMVSRMRALRAADRPIGARALPTSLLDMIVLSTPLLAGLERVRNRATIASTLGASIASGLRVLEALKLTEIVTPNGLYRRIVRKMHAAAKDGQPISAAMSDQHWPFEWRAMIEVGENSGKLDEALIRLGRLAHETYATAIREASKWIPRILYGLVSIYIVYQIVTMLRAIGGAYSQAVG